MAITTIRSLRTSFIALVTGLALLAGTPSSASVVSTFDLLNPGTILAGDSVTARLNLSLYPDGGYYNASFTGGSATIYNGAGGSQTFNIGSGGTTRQFDFTSMLAAAGEYVASFVLSAYYQQSYNSYEYLYSYSVVVGYGSYSCGWFSTCTYPIYGNQPVYGYVTRYSSSGTSKSGSEAYSVAALPTSPTVVPVPAALPLLGAGLGVLGLLGWRRRRLAAA